MTDEAFLIFPAVTKLSVGGETHLSSADSVPESSGSGRLSLSSAGRSDPSARKPSEPKETICEMLGGRKSVSLCHAIPDEVEDAPIKP